MIRLLCSSLDRLSISLMLEISRYTCLVVGEKCNRQAVGTGSESANVQREGILIVAGIEERRFIQGGGIRIDPNCIENRGAVWPAGRIV